MRSKLYLAAAACAALVWATSAVAAGRGPGRPAAPVTVENTPTVLAQQLGTWHFDFLGTPVFRLAPGSIVGIDPAANTVKLDPKGNSVNVLNFPATQAVTGTLNAHQTPTDVGGALAVEQDLAPGETESGSLGSASTPLNVTVISFNNNGGIAGSNVEFRLTNSHSGLNLILWPVSGGSVQTFPSPILADGFTMHCNNTFGHCKLGYSIAGY